MRIFICCSKAFYGHVACVRASLEALEHIVTPPNSYDDPKKENEMRLRGEAAHNAWKASMIRLQAEKIAANDGILVLNFEKNGQPNYIGGATFLEVFKAFELGKSIFMFNPLPDGIFRDELEAMNIIVIQGNLGLVRTL